MKENKKYFSGSGVFLTLSSVIGLFVWGALLVYFHYESFSDPGLFYESDSMLSFLEISYQIIFLTTSLLSLLSDKSETIYWERFTEYVMVTPKVFNFIGLSLLGFFSLFIQTICFILAYKTAFYICFGIGTAIIILLWWKMSSIFFRRDYYKHKLSAQELTKEKTDVLREFTFAAIESHNFRTVNENLDYLIGKAADSTACDNELSGYVKVSLFGVLDYLDSHNQNEWIKSFIENNSLLIRENTGLKCELFSWIISRPERTGIWNSYKDCVLDNGRVLSEMLDCMYKSHADRYPLPLNKGNEKDDKYAAFQYDTSENREEADKICRKYERFIRDFSLFAYKNDLIEEQEALLYLVLKNPDIVMACPNNNNIIDFYRQSDSFDMIIDTVCGDDKMLASFITTFTNVVNTAEFASLKTDGETAESIVCRIMNKYDQKDVHDVSLSSLFDTFMTLYVPFYSETRIKYIEKIYRSQDYNKFSEIINKDTITLNSINKTVHKGFDFLLGITLYLKDNAYSILVTPDRLELSNNNGIVTYNIRLDEENTLDDLNARLIKVERLPGPEETARVMKFMEELRKDLVQSKHLIPILKIDEYLSELQTLLLNRR